MRRDHFLFDERLGILKRFASRMDLGRKPLSAIAEVAEKGIPFKGRRCLVDEVTVGR
jgi:hypothetical protein